MPDRPPHDAFRWPPAPEGVVAAAPSRGWPAAATVQPARALTWRDHLLDIERTWLGLERPPLADLIREAAWRPEAAASCCARCGRTAGGDETLDPRDAAPAEAGCGSCRGRPMAWDRVVRLGEHEGLLRSVVLEIKFGRARGLGHDLGRELGRVIAERMRWVNRGWSEVVVVPMPPSRWRRFVRGIDHAAVLAGGVATHVGAPREAWLSRSHRPAQSTLSEASRRRNVAGAMALTRRGRRGLGGDASGGGGSGGDGGGANGDGIRGRLVLVVDDVMTTGSTMREACRRVRTAAGGGTEIWACVATVAGAGAI